MWTAKQIWEAGRAALEAAAAKDAAPPAPAPAVDPAVIAAEEDDPEFELTALDALQLEDRQYRVHFRGGTSGEYDGYTLRTSAPFPLSEVVSIDPVVGQAAPVPLKPAPTVSAPTATPAGDFYFVK